MADKAWDKLGELTEGPRVGPVAASREGFGLVGAVIEPTTGAIQERMKHRRSQLYRVTAQGVERTYEGPGWPQALDCHAGVCMALGATLKASGSGSDYHLLASTDGGKSWSVRGPVTGAPSASQVLVVSAKEAWVLGAYFLARTGDGGASWTEVALEGERNPHSERLRRTERGVALLGQGVASTQDGGATWKREAATVARVVDLEAGYLLALEGGQARVGERRAGEVRWLGALPPGKEPLRLAVEGTTLRVLTRGADPSKGVDAAVHLSTDGGKTWSTQELPVGPHMDISGPYGLGTDMRGQVFGRLA